MLTLSPDTSTKTAKLVKWVVAHSTNVSLVVLLFSVIPSDENLPLVTSSLLKMTQLNYSMTFNAV